MTLLNIIQGALGEFVDGLQAQVDLIREQQWDVAWRNYVHGIPALQRGSTAERRRWLALDLSRTKAPVLREDLRGLSPRMAQAYAAKTDKTLTRDLNALMKLDLVVREEKGFRARKELILAFLPAKRPGAATSPS